MPVPSEYKHAGDDFYAFLKDAKDEAGLWSTHVTYTMVQGVFQTFRSRLSVAEAIRFANVLPVGMRALFVADWDVARPIKPFGTRDEMAQEVLRLRPKHNFSTETAIRDVAVALRKHVDTEALDRLLADLPEGAVDYWSLQEDTR